MSLPLVLEGTWEEIAAHADELAGRKVRLTVLSPESEQEPEENEPEPETVRKGTPPERFQAVMETGEIPAPFSLPRPEPGVPVETRREGPRLPDPPLLYQPSPVLETAEYSAPFDLPRLEPGVPVEPIEATSDRLPDIPQEWLQED